jgi:hypothetical protein
VNKTTSVVGDNPDYVTVSVLGSALKPTATHLVDEIIGVYLRVEVVGVVFLPSETKPRVMGCKFIVGLILVSHLCFSYPFGLTRLSHGFQQNPRTFYEPRQNCALPDSTT